jgi:hypothetical protein
MRWEEEMSESQAVSWSCHLCPSPPRWDLTWHEIAPLEWFRPMIGFKQDPLHHAEGDVATHVRLVCEALIALEIGDS